MSFILIRKLLIIFTFILATSCGGGFRPSNIGGSTDGSVTGTQVWSFSAANDYIFDSNQIVVSGGQATINTVGNTVDTASAFAAGNHSGTIYSGGYLSLDFSTATNELNTSTPYFSELTGYWTFEGNFNDSSLEANHAAALGDAASDTALFKVGAGSSVYDGAGDYLEVTDDDSLDSDLGSNFTVSTWVRFNDLSANQKIISKSCHNGTVWVDSSFVLHKNVANSIQVELFSDGVTPSTVASVTDPVKQGVWNNYIFTYDGSNIKLYENGVLADTVAFTGAIFNSTKELVFGARHSGATCTSRSEFLNGNLDDIAIWKKTLSDADVNQVYHHQKQKFSGFFDTAIINAGAAVTWPELSWATSLPFMKELTGDTNSDGFPDSESSGVYPKIVGSGGTTADNNFMNNLVMYLKLNGLAAYNGTTNEVIDYSGTANHGTAIGGNINSGEGVNYEGRRFDGTGHRIEVNTFTSNSTFEGAKSLSFWIKVDPQQVVTTGTTNTVFRDGDGLLLSSTIGVYNQTALAADIGKVFFQADDSVTVPSPEITSVRRIDDGEFHHVVITSGPELKIYIDGVFEGSTINTTSGTYAAAYSLSINSAINNFSGDIDDIAYWSRALHEGEVLQLFRRSANRIKLQVKTCVDPSCQCRAMAGVNPNDCDNDTILNSLDSSDVNKAEWQGPTNTSLTHFSELNNNTVINSSGQGSGIVKLLAPSLVFSDFTAAGLSISDNQYIQVRVNMESSDNNLSCTGGVTCFPELSMLSLGSNNLYAGDAVIENNIAYSYSDSLASISFTEVGATPNCTFNYRLSNDDGVTWYYYSGGWVVATVDPPSPTPHYNDATTVTNNIATFTGALGAGTGEFKFKAYIKSADASSNCSLDQIEIVE